MALRLNGSTSGYVGIDAPATAASNTLVLPNGNGSNGQALTTNGSGTLSWTSITGSQWTTSGSDINYTTGKVLVGSSSARSPVSATPLIQVEGTTYATSSISITQNSNDSNSANFYLAKSRSGSLGGHAIVQNGDEIGSIDFLAADGTQMLRAARIQTVSDGTPGSNDMPGRLVFSTTADGASNPTERMRINSAGRVQISDAGATDPAFGLLEITRSQDQPDNRFHLAFHRRNNWVAGMGFLDNSQIFAIQNASVGNNTGNGVTLSQNATSWGTTSDERKKRIGLTIQDGLEKIADWRCIYFSYLNEPEDVQRVGLIAQDVQQTVPEAISVEDDETGTLQLRYTELIPVLVKALQESKERIETLEAANASQTATIAALEARLTALEVTP